MASSGTVAQTRTTTTKVIEHAFRRCGKLASTISSELQLSAKDNLFYLLSSMANKGLSLWCVQKVVLGVTPDKVQFDMPAGTIDVMTTLYRTKTDLTGSTISGAGWQGIDLGAGVTDSVYNSAIMFDSATTASLVVECSSDAVTWSLVQSFPAADAIAGGTWITVDSDNTFDRQYWRVRDTSGTLPAVTTLTFSTTPYEVPMAKLSNDDYVSFPNKTFSVPAGSKSLNYWYDKQITPRIWIWPQSQGSVDQIVVWTQRQIQDVGALTLELDVPQRWLEYVIAELSCRCAVEMPAGELPAGRLEYLESKAAQYYNEACDGESDGAPIRIAPNIGSYSA